MQVVVAVFVIGCVAILAYIARRAFEVQWSWLDLQQTALAISGLLGGMVLSLLLWRMLCEFVIVVFRINESLTEFKNQERARGPASSSR